MEPVLTGREWVKRIAGYGTAAASGIVAAKVKDPELAGWLVSGVSLLAGIILNKALPFIVPTKRKIRNHFGR